MSSDAPSGSARGPRFQWPLLVMLAGVLVALGIVWTDHWRKGSFTFGAAVALGGVLRLVLPERLAGWLAVRSRWVDVAVLIGCGIAMMALTLVVPPSPPPSAR